MDPSLHRVAAFSKLPTDRGVAVHLEGADILLVRVGEAVHAVGAQCPHAGAPLAQGAVCDGVIVCPWHKARFAAATGALLDPPALAGLARYPVRRDGDAVLVGASPVDNAPLARVADLRRMLILGGGAAGIAAALALREYGFTGAVTVVGRESGQPYDRTAISKFVTSGDMPTSEVPPLCPAETLAAQGITLIQGEAIRLDPVARRVDLADETGLDYDAALLATGASPARPDLPGIDLPGVHVLRDRADAAALMAGVKPETRAVIVGSSFIALEVASGFRQQGIPVDIVSPEPAPFARQFGAAIGAMFRSLHEANGVVFHQASLAAIDGPDHAASVRLDTGASLPAGLVLLGTGVRPATGFVPAAYRQDDGGIPVDAGLRVVDGLYAAGDIARFPLADQPVRIEHWRLAQQQGRIAAANMLGGDQVYRGVPFFWTYHYGRRVEYLGHPTGWDESVTDGVPLDRFITLYAQHGQVVAALGCDREREMGLLHEAMLQPLSLSRARELLGV